MHYDTTIDRRIKARHYNHNFARVTFVVGGATCDSSTELRPVSFYKRPLDGSGLTLNKIRALPPVLGLFIKDFCC